MQEQSALDRNIWGIAWPAILSNISIPLLGLVDAAILGHLESSRYLGAVAIGGAVLSFLYWGFSFLRMGTTGLVARAVGAGDEARGLVVLAQSAVLALLLAGLVVVLHPLWLGAGLTLLAPRPELEPLASSYASIRIFSAPAVLLTYTIVGWFIGHQNTRWPMAIVLVTNIANIGLDFLFILKLGMNSDGAALATLIAEYLGCLVALVAVWRRLRNQPTVGLLEKLTDLDAYRSLLRSNRHLFVRTMCLLGAFAFFTAMGDKLGTNTVAANAILMQLVLFAAYGMDGFAYAAEALSGNRLGGGDLEGFYRAVRRCGLWTALTAASMSLMFLAFHPWLFQLLTDIPAVQTVLQGHYLWLVVLPIIAAPTYLLDGVFIGSAETRYMMNSMLTSALLVYVPLWYVTRGLGNHGLWLAFTAFNAARGITLYYSYRRMKRAGAWLP